jgi:glyoxylase-like metal-dependent hydrolase (beta-lactamase superfamily II)
MAQLYFKQLLGGRDFGRDNPFAEQMENFIYLIGDRDTHECMVVDPAWDIQGVLDAAKADGMRIVGALATHYHPDHVGGNALGMNIEGLATLMAKNPCPVHAHKLEADGIKQVTGISDSDMCKHESGDVVKVGGVEIELLHTPGHTPGSMCFRLKNALISGDTLFLQGCGRVDLPGGDSDQMYETLTQRLSTIRDDVVLYPGHAYGGQHAPMSEVRKTNSMLRVKDIQTWRRVRGK